MQAHTDSTRNLITDELLKAIEEDSNRKPTPYVAKIIDPSTKKFEWYIVISTAAAEFAFKITEIDSDSMVLAGVELIDFTN